MRLILILLSCGTLLSSVSCGDLRERTRQSRGILHGLDLRQVLAAVEPGYNLYHHQPGPLHVIQQFAVPFQPSLQPYVLTLPPLTEQYSVSAPAVAPSTVQYNHYNYNAPRPLPQPQFNAAPEIREELSSVAVAASGAGSIEPRGHAQRGPAPAPQQNYGAPAENVQPPAREYGPPQREYGVPQREYGAPAATASQSPSNQYGAPAPTSQNPSNQYGAPAPTSHNPSNQYGAPASPSNQYGAPAPTSHNPSNQYGAPQATSAKAQVQVSLPEAAQSYGLPNLDALLSNAVSAQSYGPPAPAQPNSQYGAPAPSSQYGAPAGGGSASAFSSGLGGIDISRDVSIHVPVPEPYNQQPRPQPQIRTPKKAKKNYKIIFIKAPAPPPPPVPEIPEIEPEPEQKTLVYVLVQKPEPAPPIVIPTPAPAPKSKPEVYFVKYRQAVQEEGFAQSSSSAASAEGGYGDSVAYNTQPKTGY